MQEKLLLFILKWQMPVFTKVFLSSLWLFSSLLYMQILTQLPTLPNEIRKSLLPEGLIERFPPGLPTLFNYNKWSV
jgi:hypothetical protein